jgi:pimeloyl-ACP methyl ester carboxylesterase
MKTLASIVIVAVLMACGSATSSPGPTGSAAPTAMPSVAPAAPPTPTVRAAATIEDVDCPADVTGWVETLVQISCSYLTVPENRSTPNGRTIRLFVTHTLPDEQVADDPVVLLGADLGWSPLYGLEFQWRPNPEGEGVMATRVGREIFNLDLRGVGHSEPLLNCPNVDRLRITAPGTSTGDHNFDQVLLDAVRQCRDDLVGQGVDLSAYNIDEMAADVEDLRVALDLGEWNLETLGDSSYVAFELLRRSPPGLRTVVLDTPAPPGSDRFSTSIVGVRDSTANLVDQCNANTQCRLRFPDIDARLRSIFNRAREDPIVVDPGPEQYTIDDTTLVREWIEGMGDPWFLPAIIYGPDKPEETIEGLKTDPVLSRGYTSSGMDAPNLMYGAFYSTVCHDEMPFIDRDALNGLASDEPWLVDAFADSLYWEICGTWDVGAATDDPHRAVASEAEVLAFTSPFAPYAPRPLLEEGLSSMPNATLVNVTDNAGNVLAWQECTIQFRNHWLNAPQDPRGPDCIADHIDFEL